MGPRLVGKNKMANSARAGSASARNEREPAFAHADLQALLASAPEEATPAATGGSGEGRREGLESSAESLKREREASPRRGGGREEGFRRSKGRERKGRERA